MTRRLLPFVARSGLLLGLLLSRSAAAQAPGGATPPAPPPAPAEPITAPAPEAAPASPASPAPDSSPSELEKLRELSRTLEERVAQLEQAQAEAQVLNAATEQTEALPVERAFQVYGFADFGLNHAWLGDKSFLRGLINSETTFVLGNLNLYFDFRPDPAWQVLTEVRFTAYPDGVEEAFATPLGGEYLRVDTEVVDLASPATGSQFDWGGIFIERAYAQWSYDERLNIRVGQFLTPYGIWNVDHGTPTLIALMLPHFVSSQIFPARQLGVDVNGAFMTGGWELGYDAYISNGRTATQLDFTGNKAFGGRLRASRIAPVPLMIGASAYYGQIDDIEKTIVSFEPFRIERDLVVEGTEWGAGVDFSLDIDELRIRTEGIMRQTRFEPGKRPQRMSAAPGSTEPDNNEYAAYLLLAYQLPFLGLEPFAYGEYNHYVSPYGDDQSVLSLGLNIHFTAFAQLKTQVARVVFFDLDDNDGGNPSDNNMTLLFSRLAVAF